MTQSSSLSNKIYHKNNVYRYRYVGFVFCFFFHLALPVLAITIIIKKKPLHQVANKIVRRQNTKNAGNNMKNSLTR